MLNILNDFLLIIYKDTTKILIIQHLKSILQYSLTEYNYFYKKNISKQKCFEIFVFLTKE